MRTQLTVRALAAVALIALPSMAAAQVQQWTPSRDPLAVWSVPQWPGPDMRMPIPMQARGLPLPTIGLPLPPTTIVPATPRGRTQHSQMPSGSPHGRPHWNGQQVYGQQVYGQQFYGPQVYATIPLFYMTPIVDAVQHALPPPAAPPEPAKGSVALVVQPGSAQVRVDGYYVGTADEFDGTQRTLMLDAGPHTIELSENGFEAMRFQVMADARQPIVYRRELSRVASPSVPPAAADWKPSPMWTVPGCYIGNVPPKEAGLPATCDPARGVRIR